MKLSSFLIPLVPSLVTAFTVAPLVPKTSSSSALFFGGAPQGDFGADRHLREDRFYRDDRNPMSDSFHRENSDMSRRASYGTGTFNQQNNRMMNRGGFGRGGGRDYEQDWDRSFDGRRGGGFNQGRYGGYNEYDQGHRWNRGRGGGGGGWGGQGRSRSSRDYEYERGFNGRSYLDGEYRDSRGSRYGGGNRYGSRYGGGDRYGSRYGGGDRYGDRDGYGRSGGMGRNQWSRQERNRNSMSNDINSPYSGGYDRNYNTYNSFDRDYSNFGRGNDRRLSSRSSYNRY